MRSGDVPVVGRKLPKVEAMRTPRLDHFMHTLALQTAKVADRKLFRIQTFVLDPLAPLTTILDNTENMSIEEIKEASTTAVELIGNANAKILCVAERSWCL